MSDLESRCFVVDANVAFAASEKADANEAGIRCRRFLVELRDGSHRLAWCMQIRREWDRHQSKFSRTWRTIMEQRGRILEVPLPQPDLRDLTQAIRDSNPPDLSPREIEKDVPYAAVALRADRLLASHDGKFRARLAKAVPAAPGLAELQWQDPVVEADGGVAWVQAGAPFEIRRCLASLT